MAPPKSPAGDKPAPKKPAPPAESHVAQATEVSLEPVVSSETVVSRLPEGLSTETLVGVIPSAESAFSELKTGEIEPLPQKPLAPRRADEPQKRKPTAEVQVARETMVASPKAIALQGGVVPKEDDVQDQVTDRKPALKAEPKRSRTAGEVKVPDLKAQSTMPDLARPSGRLDERAEAPRTGESEALESRKALRQALEVKPQDERVSTLAGSTNPSLRARGARLDRLVIGVVAGALVIVLTAVLLVWGSGTGKKAPPRHRAVQHDEADEPRADSDLEQPAPTPRVVPVAAPAPTPAAASDAGLSGLVRFSSEPPADVYVGGENKGTTPLLLALPAGLTKAVFNCTRLGLKRTVELDVVAGRETEASTVFATGWVELHAKSGAAITVDGKPVSNKLLSLLTGTHRIEARFPGGGVASQTVEVVSGMTITVYLEPDTSER